MKRFLLIIVPLLIQLPLSAQQKMILRPDGSLSPITKSRVNNEIRYIDKHKLLGTRNNSLDFNREYFNSPTGNIDTLRLPDTWASNQFVFYSQDWLLQWFQCPTDLILKKVGFSCAGNDSNASMEVKVVKVNWSYEDIFDAPVERHGYYEAAGNGYNDITAFIDNPDRTGSWVSEDGGLQEPFGEDVWSIDGIGDTIVPTVQPDASHYDWVDLSQQQEVVLSRGEIFGIAIHHLGTDLNNSAEAIGFYYNNDFDIGGWKFYAGGRLTNEDYGWWSRMFSWDFVAEVDLGNECPLQVYVTNVDFAYKFLPVNIAAYIYPSFSSTLIVKLNYSSDGGNIWDTIQMFKTDYGYFIGTIPAYTSGTNIDYYVTAVDTFQVPRCTGQSIRYDYTVISPHSSEMLVVFNGLDTAIGFPQRYYFGPDDPANPTFYYSNDAWAYGPLTMDLVSNYNNILEICTSGPNDINSEVIRNWLEADPSHNYMLMGDEWLTLQVFGKDTTYHSGDFQYDILGIQNAYNDISYADSGDQYKPSIVYPQNSLLCDSLLFRYNQISADSNWTAPMLVDPWLELQEPNLLDGVDFLPDVEVDMKGLAYDGATIYNIGGHRTLPAGNKIVFFAFDGLSLDSHTGKGTEHYWYGYTVVAPRIRVLNWFGILTDVEENKRNTIPNIFELYQNYPNPFNPTTKIRFRIAKFGLVTLKVYDVLGREVATLVNEDKIAGTYEIEFDGHSGEALNLTSGVYFYQLRSGSFVETKKMILLR